jgi:hypothetical protein
VGILGFELESCNSKVESQGKMVKGRQKFLNFGFQGLKARDSNDELLGIYRLSHRGREMASRTLFRAMVFQISTNR